jgi:periplasmic protein TonB
VLPIVNSMEKKETNKKKILLLLTFAVLFVFCRAQNLPGNKEETFYALDKDWKGTVIEKAAYLLRSYKLNDTCWHWDTYQIYGPLVSVEHFKDKDGAIPHGKFIYYNKSGRQDSSVEFKDGLRDGDTDFYNDTGAVTFVKKYIRGNLYKVIDVQKENASKKDTTVANPVEKESEFKGGISSWARYLNKNLTYPVRAINNNAQGKVVLRFVVDTAGLASDIEIVQSVEFSLDEEALRIIKQSPPWTPAEINGRKVKSYKAQPILFRLQ